MANKSISNTKKAHIFIEGRVQGVGFRYFTKTNAQKLGLAGWVKNRADGRVEAIFEGPKEDVLKMIEQCQKGPRASKVNNIDLEWEEVDSTTNSFQIKRT